MGKRIQSDELNCPLCGNGPLSATHIPASIRNYMFDGEDVSDHFGESCDVECSNCGFQFNYHTDQDA